MEYLESELSSLRERFTIDGRAGSFEIDIYSDTHFGSKNTDESLLRRHIKETEKENRYWIFLGDGADCVLPMDKRHNASNLTDWAWEALREGNLIQAEYERWEGMFAPIAGRCLGYLMGDGKHSAKKDVADCRGAMLKRLNIPGPFQLLYYTFIIGRDETPGHSMAIPLVFHHGFFAGRTSSTKIINLERVLNYFPEAWGFFCGHGHTKVMTPPIVGIVQRGKTGVSLYRRAAMTGSYLRTYAEGTIGYGETKLYPPVALGRITVRLAPFSPEEQKRIEIFNI